MKRTLLPLSLLLPLLGACAADGTALDTRQTTTPASKATVEALAPPTTGEVVMVEPLAPVSQRGGAAALQVGASILGALIPGPWGSVAGVATSQVGGIAMQNTDTKSARYHVRLSDGTIETFEQDSALTLSIGTPVDILTLSDGTRLIVQSGLPTVPASTTTTTSATNIPI